MERTRTARIGMATLTVAALGLLIGTGSASAAVVSDPALASGSGSLDPTGAEEVDSVLNAVSGSATSQNATAQSTLESRGDFRVWQDVGSGFDGFSASPTNIVDFTGGNDATHPDLRFTLSGDVHSDAGSTLGPSVTGNNKFNTSTGDSDSDDNYRLQSPNAGDSLTLTITFGTWDGSTFTADRSVGAAGFTLPNIRGDGTSNHDLDYTIKFIDGDGTDLETQTLNSAEVSDEGNGDGSDGYVGHDASGNRIAEVSLTRTDTNNSGAQTGSSLDDFGFTVIPEPGSLALLGVAGLCLTMRRRR